MRTLYFTKKELTGILSDFILQCSTYFPENISGIVTAFEAYFDKLFDQSSTYSCNDVTLRDFLDLACSTIPEIRTLNIKNLAADTYRAIEKDNLAHSVIQMNSSISDDGYGEEERAQDKKI